VADVKDCRALPLHSSAFGPYVRSMPQNQITLTQRDAGGPFDLGRPLFPLSPDDVRALLDRQG